MHILCTTGSLHCGIFRLFSYLLCTVDRCNCMVCLSNPLVTPIHNETTCAKMVIFLQNRCMRVLKDIVDKKQVFNENLTSFIR